MSSPIADLSNSYLSKQQYKRIRVMSSGETTPKADVVRFKSQNINHSCNSQEEIKKLEQYAKSLGIEAYYGSVTKPGYDKCSIHLAKLINEALTDVKNAGYNLTKKVIYGHGNNSIVIDLFRSLTNTAACHIHESNTIFLNPDTDWSYYIERDSNKACNQKEFSSNNPKHFIYHELGHSNTKVWKLVLYNILNSIHINNFDNKKGLIEKEVSKYASNGVTDFVAEIFAGNMAGKTYPDNIMKLYYELGGPKPKIK